MHLGVHGFHWNCAVKILNRTNWWHACSCNCCCRYLSHLKQHAHINWSGQCRTAHTHREEYMYKTSINYSEAHNSVFHVNAWQLCFLSHSVKFIPIIRMEFSRLCVKSNQFVCRSRHFMCVKTCKSYHHHVSRAFQTSYHNWSMCANSPETKHFHLYVPTKKT